MVPANRCFYIFKLFCLAPFSSSQQIERVFNIYGSTTVLALFINITLAFCIDFYGSGYYISSLISISVFILAIASHVVTIVESLTMRKHHEMFFTKLQELDDFYQVKLRSKVRVDRMRRKLIRKFVFICSVVLIFYIFLLLYLLLYPYDGFFWNTLFSLTVTWLRTIQLSIYVELINFRLKKLNSILMQILEYKLHPNKRLMDIDYRFIEHQDRILDLKSSYAKVYDVVNCLNDAFGWSTLMIVVYFCVNFLCDSYWLFLVLEKKFHPRTYYFCCVDFTPPFLLLVVYCCSCSKVVENSNITRGLVQKMFVKASNKHLNYLLNDFLLQIHHNAIQFHAKRFFLITTKLLVKVCVLITGYLAILIQFVISENVL